MALLLFDGFETGANVRNSIIPSATISTVTGRDGVGKAIVQNGSSASITVPLPTNAATCVLGIGIKASAFGAAQATIEFRGDAGATQHTNIKIASDGKLQLFRGSTLLATSTLSITANVWHYFEMKGTIADSGGICIVKVNGVEFINFTGDTKNAGTLASVSSIILAVNSLITIDDLYVLDGTGATYNDFIGERVIKAARPVGNGALSQLLGSDGNSIDNWQNVDDDPFSTADLNSSATAGDRDTYDMGAVSGLASVDAVQVVVHGAKSDSGAKSIKTVIRSGGGTIVVSSSIPLSTTYASLQGDIRLTDADGNAWTQVTVNSHEYGVEVV